MSNVTCLILLCFLSLLAYLIELVCLVEFWYSLRNLSKADKSFVRIRLEIGMFSCSWGVTWYKNKLFNFAGYDIVIVLLEKCGSYVHFGILLN